MGCDPEIFFKRKGHVVGSEFVLKEDTEFVVKDGVQGELNPKPSYCRNILMRNIMECMLQLSGKAIKNKVTVNKDVTVEVSKRHYKSLSDKSKEFGCMPSFNIHTNLASINDLDPETCLTRSAGGHIHLSSESYTNNNICKAILEPKKLVPILDIVLGNTCVLLDRDEGNIERRKSYGQAGEYRTPVHGLEYRVLSNFWLRGTPLMSLVFGLARHAVALREDRLDGGLKKLVSMDDVIQAINTNDKKLAQKNFNKIKDYLMDTTYEGAFYPITKNTIGGFQKLVDEGIDKHFPYDIVDVWTKKNNYLGFNQFARLNLKP